MHILDSKFFDLGALIYKFQILNLVNFTKKFKYGLLL